MTDKNMIFTSGHASSSKDSYFYVHLAIEQFASSHLQVMTNINREETIVMFVFAQETEDFCHYGYKYQYRFFNNLYSFFANVKKKGLLTWSLKYYDTLTIL